MPKCNKIFALKKLIDWSIYRLIDWLIDWVTEEQWWVWCQNIVIFQALVAMTVSVFSILPFCDLYYLVFSYSLRFTSIIKPLTKSLGITSSGEARSFCILFKDNYWYRVTGSILQLPPVPVVTNLSPTTFFTLFAAKLVNWVLHNLPPLNIQR